MLCTIIGIGIYANVGFILFYFQYSGHLLLMTTLYAMLFDDDRYEEEGALTFLYNPVFYGMGPETYPYTRSTLQDAIVKEMERNGWLGVCCEPNSIFIVCNQFPVCVYSPSLCCPTFFFLLILDTDYCNQVQRCSKGDERSRGSVGKISTCLGREE